MFYDDLLVPIPRKKRIRKGSNYVYEILKRKGKNSPKDVVACVGKAVDEIHMIPNEIYYEIHKEAIQPEPKEKLVSLDASLNIGAYLLIKNLALQEGFYDCLKNTYMDASNVILSFITYSLINQTTDAKFHKFFGYNHYSGLNYVPNEIKLMQFFNKIFDGEHTKKFKKLWSENRFKRSEGIEDYTLNFSSFNVSSEQLKYSFSKNKVLGDSDLFNYSINYVLEASTGIPVYYDIYIGHTLDLIHGYDIINCVKSHRPGAKFNIVLEKEYCTKENVEVLNDHNIPYFLLSNKTKLFKYIIKEHPQTELYNNENKVFSLIYGIKLNTNDESSSLKEHVKQDSSLMNKDSELTYHFYLFNNQTYVRERATKQYETVQVLSSLLLGKYDPKKIIKTSYGKFIKVKYDENKNVIKAVPNMNAINNYNKELGYNLCISNVDTDIESVYALYRRTRSFENAFQIGLKTPDDLNRISRIYFTYNALGTIGFLNAIIKNIIINRASKFIYKFPNETSLTILYELDKICATKVNNKYVLQYALSRKQKELLEIFGLGYEDVMNLIDEMNEKLKEDEENNK